METGNEEDVHWSTPSVNLTPPIFLISVLWHILHKQPVGVTEMSMELVPLEAQVNDAEQLSIFSQLYFK